MEHKLALGQSNLEAPRMGSGAMIWGQPNGKQAAENAGVLSFSLTPAEIKALNQATMAWRA